MPANKETIAATLKAYLSTRVHTQKEAADLCGISTPHFANLLNARETIGFAATRKICDAFPEINSDYLLKGEGSLLKVGAQPTTPIERPKIYTDSASAQEEILKLREELARKTREADRLLGIIETLTKK